MPLFRVNNCTFVIAVMENATEELQLEGGATAELHKEEAELKEKIPQQEPKGKNRPSSTRRRRAPRRNVTLNAPLQKP